MHYIFILYTLLNKIKVVHSKYYTYTILVYYIPIYLCSYGDEYLINIRISIKLIPLSCICRLYIMESR